jgi:hypothetical protein
MVLPGLPARLPEIRPPVTYAGQKSCRLDHAEEGVQTEAKDERSARFFEVAITI